MTDQPWLPGPPAPELAHDQVHVWRAWLDEPLTQPERTLAGDELVRADRLRAPEHRRRFVAARAILRAILGRYLQADPAGLRFGYSAHGKPYLEIEPGRPALEFNLSHAGGLGLYAVACGRAVGVDIEALDRAVEHEQIAARFFAPSERQQLAALPPALRRAAFFAGWVRKEAYVKAHGQGLALPLEQFGVALAPGEPARLLHADYDPHEPSRWSLAGLAPAPGYAGALAVAGHGWRLACWQWV